MHVHTHTRHACTDLDKQVEADPSLLDDYLRGEKDKLPDRRSRPRVHSHSSYSSVVITRRPDGVGSLASSPDGVGSLYDTNTCQEQ